MHVHVHVHVHLHAHTCLYLITDRHVPRAAAAIVPLEGGVELRELESCCAVNRREPLKAGGVAQVAHSEGGAVAALFLAVQAHLR